MMFELSNLEWWYFFAYLNGERGGRYAVMASFFEVGELNICKGHLLITTLIDLNQFTRQNYSFFDTSLKWNMLSVYLPFYLIQHPLDTPMWALYFKLLFGEIPSPHSLMKSARVRRKPTRLLYSGHKLSFHGKKDDSFSVYLPGKNTKIDLEFTPTKELQLIGGDGKPDKLYYYSLTRNQVEGKIQMDKGCEKVKGQGWFDHQWGRDYGLLTGFGWNWFGLQLLDGRELLLNEKRSNNSGKTFSPMANLIDEHGSLQFTREVYFKELAYWQSPKTKTKYPIQWEIRIPDFSIHLHVIAVFPDQEMPVFGPLRAIWEGACIFSGEEILPHDKTRSLKGEGFMELVGYPLPSPD